MDAIKWAVGQIGNRLKQIVLELVIFIVGRAGSTHKHLLPLCRALNMITQSDY